MPTRLSIALVASLAFGLGWEAGASPITFAYSGTLDQAFNGSRQFGGTFTIDGDPKLAYDGSVQEGGNDVTGTLKLGGQVFNFANPPQDNGTKFGTNAYFSLGLSPSWLQSWTQSGSGQPQYATIIAGNSLTGYGGPNATISLEFYGPSTFDHSNLRDLNFPLSDEPADLTYSSGSSGFFGHGSIDSIGLVTTPEPRTLAIFAALGAAAIAFRRRPRA